VADQGPFTGQFTSPRHGIPRKITSSRLTGAEHSIYGLD
jgi:hypothetical protein